MRRRISIFFVVISLLSLVSYTFLSLSLLEGAAHRSLLMAVLVIPFALVWLMPMVYWEREEKPEETWERFFVWSSMLSMGLLSFLLTFTFLRDILFFSFNFFNPHLAILIKSRDANLGIFILSLFSVAVGVYLALRGPIVKKVNLYFPGLSKDLEGIKIAQISDLHVGSIVRKRYVKDVVFKTNSLLPDFICLTGDIFDGAVKHLKNEIQPLSNLKAKYAKYYITGNHEYYWGAEAWLDEVKTLGLTALLNTHVEHRILSAKILFAGVVDFASGSFFPDQKPDPEKAIEGSSLDSFKILLVHQPKMAELAQSLGFNLQLSGHTHGGQFVPWTYVASWFHTHFTGLSRLKTLQVYVNPGTGFWGPPLRLGTTTEITLLTLTGSPQSRSSLNPK
jgi:predicted MPP superfamily phosphohydrolase